MLNSEIQLSVIIVNYRSGQYLKNCIASLFKYLKKINFEIIIVNNDRDESLEEITEEFPGIKLIKQQKNIGFGAANNAGAKIVQGKYLLLLNPDTEILADGIAEIFAKFAQNKRVAAIGPRLIASNGKTQWWCTGKEISFWQLVKNKFGAIESKKIWESSGEISVDWISGTAMFVKKEAFDKIGGFDENFFMYFEDVDLCQRMRAAGYEILYYPEISVLHKGGQSREGVVKQKIQYYKALVYYFKKRRQNV